MKTKEISGWQKWLGGTQYTVMILYGTLKVEACHYMFFKTHKMYATPRVTKM